MSSTPPDFSLSLTANLPHRDVTQAIGELWIRFFQLEAWVDVALGQFLGFGWSATLSVVANVNMRAKLDVAESLLALRVQRFGDSPERQALAAQLKKVARLVEERNTFAHGRFLLEVPGEVGELIRSRTGRNHIKHKSKVLNSTAIRSLADTVEHLTNELMWSIESEFASFDISEFFSN